MIVKKRMMNSMISLKQLCSWGCMFNDLWLGKPSGDFYIDDKGINSNDFFKELAHLGNLRVRRQQEPVKRVPKGWGHELWIANCEKYCGKLLYIKKGNNVLGISIS